MANGTLDIMEFINRTTLCPKYKTKAESSKREIHTIQINISNDHWIIKVVNAPHKGTTIHVDHSQPQIVWEQTRKINGEQRDTILNEFGIKVKAEPNELPLDTLEKIWSHLIRILRPKNINVELKNVPKLKNLFIWNQVSRFTKITVTGNQPTAQEMKFLLKNVSCKEIDLNNQFRGYETPKRHDMYFHGGFSSWTNISSVSINPRWRHFEMTCTGLDATLCQINRIIREWIDGKSESLENLYINWTRTQQNECGQILQGIRSWPTLFSKEMMKTRGIWGYCSIVDIKRRKDGRRATVTMGHRFMCVLVWHREHLNEIKKKYKKLPEPLKNFIRSYDG